MGGPPLQRPAPVNLIARVVFTAGSAPCALAANSSELIAFRVLQAVGGGMLTPIGQRS